MGAGKTSVGANLSALLGFKFIDADYEIEQNLGISINEQFNLYGEDYFRIQESLVLKSLSAANNIVFATGGGCILKESNRFWLIEHGLICYLRVSPMEQFNRLEVMRNRPLLPNTAEQRIQYLTDMHAIRSPIYESMANISIDTDGQNIEYLADKIFNMIKETICI